MNKQIFSLLLLGMILLSVSSVSALELNPFADKKIYEPILKDDSSTFLKEEFNADYGIIRLSKTFFWIETDKLAEYSLIDNTAQCLVNCEARGRATLYTEGQLFDDLRFIGTNGEEKDLLNAKYLIKEKETYEVEVPQYKEVCSEIPNNLTKGELISSCKNEIVSYSNESREREVWNEYKGQVLAPGDYEWKVIAYKKPLESADFIPIVRGKALDEWAWWDGDWSYKKEVTITESSGNSWTNYSTKLFVDKEAGMNADYSDLRFVDSTETTELPYWIEYSNTTLAVVWVKTPLTASSSNTIFMYYGNAGASTSSSISTAFLLYETWASIDTGIWSNDASFSVSGGEVVLYGNGRITTQASYGNFSVLTRWKHQNFGSWTQFSTIYRASAHSGTFGNICTDTEATTHSVLNADGSSTNTGWTHAKETYYYEIGNMFGTNTTIYQLTQAPATPLWFNATASDTRIRTASSSFSGYFGYWTTNTDKKANVDLTIIRQFSNPEPTSSFGAEQQAEGVDVNLDSPIDSYETTDTSIFFNATIVPTSANITNVTWRAGSQTDFQTLNTNESITLNWTKTFTDGTYSWNVTACWLGESATIDCTESATRTFEVDSILPSFEVISPLTNYSTLTLPINVTLNVSTTDANLGSCWFNSTTNATLTYHTCNTSAIISFNTTGAQSITYYANDTFGNENSTTIQFTIFYVQPTATATNPITEGGSSTHSLWVNMTNIKDFPTTAYLVWNGTTYANSTATQISNDSWKFERTIVVPNLNITASSTTTNWQWFYGVQGVASGNVSGTQTYIPINISECGAGTYQILNYTLYDQKTKAIADGSLNGSIETDLTLTSQANSSQTWTFHTTKTGSNNLLICLPTGALNNSAYQLDSIAKYSFQDHVVQYHYIVNFNLNSTTIPQTIKLYDLASSESTSFLINYQDENYLYVENAIIDVWRRYVGEGVFLSVEHGKTNAQGQTRLHLVTEDIIYKFLVWIDGELVYTSPEYLALCQATPCQINLRKSVDETDGFSERDNILYTYSFNKTSRTATFDFTTKDGTETEINMTILSSNAYANETACSTTLTTSGGQISCAIPTAFTNTSYQTFIYKDGEYFGTSVDSLAPSSMELFGYTGIVLTALGYLFLALMGISSGIATIIFGIIGLVLMGIIQLFESGSIFGLASAIIWLVVAGIIIIVKITKRRIQ